MLKQVTSWFTVSSCIFGTYPSIASPLVYSTIDSETTSMILQQLEADWCVAHTCWKFFMGLHRKSLTWGQNLTLHLLSLGSHSTRQMCHPRNLSCWQLPSSWHHLSGSYLIIGRDITKKVRIFSVERKEIERLPCNSLCGLQTDCLNGILIKSSCCETLFYFSFGILCINN